MPKRNLQAHRLGGCRRSLRALFRVTNGGFENRRHITQFWPISILPQPFISQLYRTTQKVSMMSNLYKSGLKNHTWKWRLILQLKKKKKSHQLIVSFLLWLHDLNLDIQLLQTFSNIDFGICDISARIGSFNLFKLCRLVV